jgi:hypothetical protein
MLMEGHRELYPLLHVVLRMGDQVMENRKHNAFLFSVIARVWELRSLRPSRYTWSAALRRPATASPPTSETLLETVRDHWGANEIGCFVR